MISSFGAHIAKSTPGFGTGLACAPPPMTPGALCGRVGGVVVLLLGAAGRFPVSSATLPTARARGLTPPTTLQRGSYRTPAVNEWVRRCQRTRCWAQRWGRAVAGTRAGRSPAGGPPASDADVDSWELKKRRRRGGRRRLRVTSGARVFVPRCTAIRCLHELTSTYVASNRASVYGQTRGAVEQRVEARLPLEVSFRGDFFCESFHWPRES